MSIPKALLALLALLIPLLTLRILAILPSRRSRPTQRKRGSPTHLLVVLGSGGHTAEMTAMLRNAVKGRDSQPSTTSTAKSNSPDTKALDWRNYTHRTWIVSSGDNFSATRAKELEDEFAGFYRNGTTNEREEKAESAMGTYTISTVPRARRIHQPLYSTPLTSLQTLLAATTLLYKSPHGLPDLVLINGPATATILVAATMVLRFFDIRGAQTRGKCRTVYVESWARVKKLSLSGRLLCWMGVERVLVQWEGLKGVGGRGEYLGVLV